jgi:triacylglycerol lipase
MSLWSRWRRIVARDRGFRAALRSRAAALSSARSRRSAGQLPSAPLPRVDLARRLRIVRTKPGPMRVVYEDAVVHEKYSLRARVVQHGARLVLKPLMYWVPMSDNTIRALRTVDRMSARGPRSRFVEPVRFELGGVAVESMTHRFGPSSDMTILYFHGGGFFSCGIETHRRICERLALYSGGSVISVDYVQLPEGNVADSVQDAINAYEGLLETVQNPDKIVVAGDSAGGYLTMKVAELASRRGLPAPAALLTFSPLLSIDPDSETKGIQTVIRARDAYLPRHRIATVRERWLPAGAVVEGYTSPLHAANYINSPTFFVAVEDELLRPEVEAMALQMAERDVEVEIHLWRGLVHAFPVMADALPEGRQALQLAAEFARRAVGEAPAHSTHDARSHAEPIVGELVGEEPTAVEQPEIIDVELEPGVGRERRKRWHFEAG